MTGGLRVTSHLLRAMLLTVPLSTLSYGSRQIATVITADPSSAIGYYMPAATVAPNWKHSLRGTASAVPGAMTEL